MSRKKKNKKQTGQLAGLFFLLAMLKQYCDFVSLLIAVEGTKTPAGEARQSRPRRHEVSRRLGGRPRKAKCLERKSTTLLNRVYIV